MGSIESGRPWKRSISSRQPKFPSAPKRRSRFQKLGCKNLVGFMFLIGLVGSAAGLFCFLFQLPGTTVEKSETRWRGYGDSNFWKEIDDLDFGNGFKFEPSKVLAKFQKDSNKSSLTRVGLRLGFRKPQLALVLHDLQPDPEQLLMVTLVNALQTIGYEVEVYSPADGPVFSVWQHMGIHVTIVKTSEKDVVVDWLKYEGVILNSFEGREFFSRLLQEPFKSIPVIWSIHDRSLGTHLAQYKLSGQIKLENDWRRFFNRSTVVVFPNYALPIFYSSWDAGNYFVIPGTPAEAWEADKLNVPLKDKPQVESDHGPNNLVIAVVGSQFTYRGLWLEHAFILKGLASLAADLLSNHYSSSHLKIIVSSGETSGNYSAAIEAIARNLEYPRNTVRHVYVDESEDSILSMADLVIYGSFLEEKSFPSILIKSMCLGKPVIAPDLPMIRKYIDHRVNGYLFPKDNIKALMNILLDVISGGKVSRVAQNIALTGKRIAKNLMVSETVEGYAFLLENILHLPSEVTPPKAITEIPSKLKEKWLWAPFESLLDSTNQSRISRRREFLEKIEEQWNSSQKEISNAVSSTDEVFLYTIWEEEKNIETANTRKRREDEEVTDEGTPLSDYHICLYGQVNNSGGGMSVGPTQDAAKQYNLNILLKDRTEQPRGTYEDVYRSVKKAERSKSELHERDEGELERTGQPLCIYEPYFGEGTWPFLHHTSLYRGIGLSTRGRRPATDDIDAPSRLPVLSNPYYRDALGEFGAFFAIANRVDRIHKNAWIGFQSWRATAKKESLSKVAETALLNAIEARKHGDALYFWTRMDVDPREQLTKDFWSFCDALNAGNCKFAFSEALKKMYGIKHNWTSIPPMPIDGDTWSVKHNWALPTKSFLEFVMFSRMFVDALDAQFYEEHFQSGHCFLSLSKDKHCYSRVLELLVNVWAYHSARRMVYVNPETGDMQSQHKLKNRKGHMWIKWFSYTTLKTMDEDLAEEFDSAISKRRWLWPSTGEVFWRGMFERERNQRSKEKEKRKRNSKDKILRMKKRYKQKTIGKYVKPLPEEVEEGQGSNSTLVDEAKLFR